MNIKKTIVASLLVCMLPAAVMAKDLSVGVSMALFDDNFLTILRTAMQKEMQKDGVKSQVEDAKGDVSQQLQQVQRQQQFQQPLPLHQHRIQMQREQAKEKILFS